MTIPGEGLPEGPDTDIEGDEDAGEEGIVDPEKERGGRPADGRSGRGPAEGGPSS